MAFPAIRVDLEIDGYMPSVDSSIEEPTAPSLFMDSYAQWGFIYIESDKRTAPPEKKRETTTYAEQEGENVDPRTVDDVFDYKVKFLIECPNYNIDNANRKIKAFNDAIRSVDPQTGIKTCRRITLWNYYKRVKITGIPEIIAEPTEFYRDNRGQQLDCVLFELTIHVDKPSDCDFAINKPL